MEFLDEESILATYKESIQLALVLFSQWNIDFADALLGARAIQSDDPVVISFDRDLDRIPGLIRQEP